MLASKFSLNVSFDSPMVLRMNCLLGCKIEENRPDAYDLK